MKELREFLRDNDIPLTDNISKHIKGKGDIVKAKVKGGLTSTTVSAKAMGVKEESLTDDSRALLSKHTKEARIQLVPKDDEDLKAIGRIGNNLRKKIEALSIGYDNSFIPKDKFDELEEYFMKCEEDFNLHKERLVSRYGEFAENFVRIVRNSLRDFKAEDGEIETQRILDRIPTREQFEDTFEMSLYISDFPELEGHGERMKEDSVRELVKDSMLNVVEHSLTALSKVIIAGADNGKIHHNTLGGIKNACENIKQGNVFDNPVFEKLGAEMLEIVNTDAEEAIEITERLMGEFYMYAIHKGIEKELLLKDCPFTREEMVDFYNMYNM